MSKQRHTPGPWVVGREWDTYGAPRIDIMREVELVKGAAPVTYHLSEVAYPTSPDGTVGAEERRANARLIAAAPELLEALEALERSAPDVCCGDFNHRKGDFHEADEACPPLDRWHAACLAARAAIAKARGES